LGPISARFLHSVRIPQRSGSDLTQASAALPGGAANRRRRPRIEVVVRWLRCCRTLHCLHIKREA
jgi:hypothetical protein